MIITSDDYRGSHADTYIPYIFIIHLMVTTSILIERETPYCSIMLYICIYTA